MIINIYLFVSCILILDFNDLKLMILLPRLRLHRQRLQVLEPAEPGPGQEELRGPGDLHGGLLHPGGEL